MEYVFDCRVAESTLDEIAQSFVPERDVYFFDNETIAHTCVRNGLTVYSRQEFTSSFPGFALKYGSVYQLWSMKLPHDVFVLEANSNQLSYLTDDTRLALLTQQVEFERGHIYDREWLNSLRLPLEYTAIGGKWLYFLTWNDWSKFSPDIRRRWIVEWLRHWRRGDAEGVRLNDFQHDSELVPYELIKEYAGTFASKSTANCFGGAIGMAIGASNPEQGRVVISEWLHQGPFFRLLQGQGYAMHAEYCDTVSLVFEPTDVLVWCTGDGTAGHAAYAVSYDLVFQKHGKDGKTPGKSLESKTCGTTST